MRRLTAAILLLLPVLLCTLPGRVLAQDDARRRQAAAEAYDRGTAAYLDGDYTEAAQWFETAHRMAPAAPALVQAIRSHQRAENFARAATLALRLQEDYAADKASADYAASVIADLGPQHVRVDVSCDQDCKLDLDGKLQESSAFFIEPGKTYRLTATFETGPQTEEIQGDAGSTRSVQFVAPPPPEQPVGTEAPGDGTGMQAPPADADEKPLDPLYTYIGAGLTGALLVGTVISGVDANAGAPAYEKAAKAANDCYANGDSNCDALYADAQKKLKAGEDKEMRTNILIAATAAVGVGTAVIALFLTNWSSGSDDEGDSEGEASASFGVAPTRDGAMGFVRGRF